MSSREQMLEAVADRLCGRCGGAAISEFYSIGSFAHIQRRKAWIRGEIIGCPPPIPKVSTFKRTLNAEALVWDWDPYQHTEVSDDLYKMLRFNDPDWYCVSHRPLGEFE